MLFSWLTYVPRLCAFRALPSIRVSLEIFTPSQFSFELRKSLSKDSLSINRNRFAERKAKPDIKHYCLYLERLLGNPIRIPRGTICIMRRVVFKKICYSWHVLGVDWSRKSN